MMGINLDEQRVARREEAGLHPTVTFGDKEYDLPVELPIEAVAAMGRLAKASESKDGEAITAALLETVREMIGHEAYPEFLTNRPSINDLSAFVGGIPEEYGLDSGESSGSTSPSATGARSKRASKPSTE